MRFIFVSLLLISNLVLPAKASEICHETLKKYDAESRVEKKELLLATVLKDCAQGLQSADANFRRLGGDLLKRCEKQGSKNLVRKCSVDAYRYLLWFQYP